MGSYLTDENEAEPPDSMGGSKRVFKVCKPQKENPLTLCIYWEKVAGVTGLEPAASGVTGRRSNQLSYTP